MARLHPRHATSGQTGFTLVELVIVVLIIGILASIAMPAFNRMRERAREASVKTNAHTVQLAAEDFAVQNDGVYAADDTTTLPTGDTLPDLVPVTLHNPFDSSDATPVVWTGASNADGRVGYDSSAEPGLRYTIDGQGMNGLIVVSISNGS